MNIDKKDRQIIQLLQQNARLPIAQIARQVHLARATVQERITKLEKWQVITGYHASIDEKQLNGETISAIAKLKIDSNHFDNLVEFIKQLPEVKRCCAISGEADLLIEIKTNSIANLDKLLSQIGLQQGVTHTQSDILMRTF